MGDAKDVLGLGGGVVRELRLDLGVGLDLRQQLSTNIRAVYIIGISRLS